MTPDTILQLFGLYSQKQWAALASVAMLWAWHAASDSSAIPIPQAWRPVAIVVIGEAYGSLQAAIGGMPWPEALLHGGGVAIFTYGLLALVFNALFGGRPLPRWLARLLLLFPVPAPPPLPPAPPAPPTLPATEPPTGKLGRKVAP